MYVPSNITLVGSLVPIAPIDFALNTFLGISWLILLPYTFLGIGLMLYSQSRLTRGEDLLRKQNHELDNQE